MANVGVVPLAFSFLFMALALSGDAPWPNLFSSVMLLAVVLMIDRSPRLGRV